MRRIVKTILGALANIGMADGLYSLYHTNPPESANPAPTPEEAARIDAETIRAVWYEVGDCLRYAMASEAKGSVNG